MINPPHSYKAEIVAAHSVNYSVLIETGTYFGEMVRAQIDNFDLIYSIELSKDLATQAKKQFKDFKNVVIFEGDSPAILRAIVPLLTEPALFWLDAHYSGGVTARGDTPCPLLEELDAILESPLEHGILIDDARQFGVNEGFPTLGEIYDKMGNFTVINDIIWKI